MNSFPSGTVTFLFTDIEGSTKLAQQYPDAMSALLARHHYFVRKAFKNSIDPDFCLVLSRVSSPFNI
jgi:hypothetical protein